MRLLFISNLYEPYARGGAEVVVKRSIEAALAAGHEVALLTARPWRSGARFALRETVEAGVCTYSYYPFNLFFYADDYRWPLPARLLWHGLDQFNYHSASMVRQLLRSYKPDAVITHNLMGLGYTIPAEIRRANIKHIHVLHDIQLAVRSGLMLYGQEHGLATDGWLARPYQGAVRKQFGSPDVVVSPSNYLSSFYKNLGYFPQSRNEVLRNPVDERFYAVARAPRSDGVVRWLHVGQLAEHKGLRLLMTAFAERATAMPQQQTLTIVGAGVLRAEVEAFARSTAGVQYIERVPNTELPAIYAAHDAVIMPTLTYENSPTVVFEALAAGLPVCVSAIGGAAEAIVDGVNGYRLIPGDVQDVLRVMSLVSNPGLLFDIQKQTRQSVAGLGAKDYWQSFTAFLQSDRQKS